MMYNDEQWQAWMALTKAGGLGAAQDLHNTPLLVNNIYSHAAEKFDPGRAREHSLCEQHVYFVAARQKTIQGAADPVIYNAWSRIR